MTAKLPETWRWRTATLRARLTPEQLEALRRARTGYPPETLLGWHLARDTGALHEPTLAMIEGTAMALAKCFPWEAPPDVPAMARQWVDLRHETDALTVLASELREALAAGRVESALIRAMALGTMFTRLAFLLLDGDVIASGAASNRGRDKTRPKIKVQQEQSRSARDFELLELLKADRDDKTLGKQRSNLATAKRLAPLYNEWARSTEGRPLSVGTIRKWLAEQN